MGRGWRLRGPRRGGRFFGFFNQGGVDSFKLILQAQCRQVVKPAESVGAHSSVAPACRAFSNKVCKTEGRCAAQQAGLAFSGIPAYRS